jgi:hypothetical protein
MQAAEDPIATDETNARPYRVKLPGFISDEELGLGDAVKRITYTMGIRPCGGCDRRAAAMNRWVAFTR